MANSVLVRSFGAVAHGYSYAAGLSLVNIVGSEKEIVLAILLKDGRRPHRAPGPFHFVCVEDVLMFGPVLEVGGREAVESGLVLERQAARAKRSMRLWQTRLKPY